MNNRNSLWGNYQINPSINPKSTSLSWRWQRCNKQWWGNRCLSQLDGHLEVARLGILRPLGSCATVLSSWSWHRCDTHRWENAFVHRSWAWPPGGCGLLATSWSWQRHDMPCSGGLPNPFKGWVLEGQSQGPRITSILNALIPLVPPVKTLDGMDGELLQVLVSRASFAVLGLVVGATWCNLWVQLSTRMIFQPISKVSEDPSIGNCQQPRAFFNQLVAGSKNWVRKVLGTMSVKVSNMETPSIFILIVWIGAWSCLCIVFTETSELQICRWPEVWVALPHASSCPRDLRSGWWEFYGMIGCITITGTLLDQMPSKVATAMRSVLLHVPGALTIVLIWFDTSILRIFQCKSVARVVLLFCNNTSGSRDKCFQICAREDEDHGRQSSSSWHEQASSSPSSPNEHSLQVLVKRFCFGFLVLQGYCVRAMLCNRRCNSARAAAGKAGLWAWERGQLESNSCCVQQFIPPTVSNSHSRFHYFSYKNSEIPTLRSNRDKGI